jgi:surfactin synthase thioesterase subunit
MTVSDRLLCFRKKKAPRVRLIAFPWAGASAAVLRPLSDALGKDDDGVELHVVAYSGRAHRRALPLGGSVAAVVDDVRADVDALVKDGVPVAVYGHSFGAVVAFAAVAAGVRAVHVVVGARAAVGVDLVKDGSAVSDDDDDALVAFLAGFGVIDPVLFADAEARALLLPPLRHDLRLSERFVTDAVIDAPITALRGKDDATVTGEHIGAWARHSRGAFAHHTVDGGHLFARDQAPATALLLRRILLP